MQFLISSAWIEGESADRGVKVVRCRGQEGLRQAAPAELPQGQGLPGLPEELGLRPGGPALPHQDPEPVEQAADEGPRGHRQGHRRADHQLLQQEQDPVRHPRAARPEDHPDQDRGPGQEGQGGARRRPVLRGGRDEVLDRPGHEGRRRRADGRPEGPAGEVAGRRDLQGPQGQGRGPGQDAVRLLRLRGHEDHAGQAAAAVDVQGLDQAAAGQPAAADHARHVRQGLPEEVEGPDGVPEGLPDGRLLQRAEGQAFDGGARRPRPRRSRTRRRPGRDGRRTPKQVSDAG